MWPLVRALFLPHNFRWTLHGMELALLAALVLDLALRFSRGRARRLELHHSAARRRTFRVRRALVFGSRPGRGGIKLTPSQVSRRHLEVRRDRSGRLVARDLGSTNGTFRRGEDLRGLPEGAVLEDGDELELGHGGPVLRCAWVPAPGLLSSRVRLLAWLGLLWSGLVLGWLANLETLPAEGVAVGSVAVDFSAFLEPGPMIGVALLATLAGCVCFLSPGLGRGKPEAAPAILVLLALGLTVLYPLLPSVALRYARAAERAAEAVEAVAGEGSWQRLELRETAGGQGDAELGTAALERALSRYVQGRGALRWATNLAARDGQSFLRTTYFRQAFLLIVATLAGLGIPLWFPGVRQRAGRLVEGLRQPLSEELIRAADHGSKLARLLRPVAYWDMVFGFLAAAVVAATLWSPLGTSLGRGKSLYLTLPGVTTIQSVELVKALFVLFVTGYFARQGPLLARVARRRYLVPYALAVLGTLALTGVQADMGGLFMLGLFLGLVFVAATGHLRLVLVMPLLLLPGVALAALLGLLSVVSTRLGIWLAAQTHPLGEQLVQARQLLLSSGWFGVPPHRQLAALVPDIQGDLVFAAFAERFGFLGLLALVACWFVLVGSLLRESRRATGGAAILLAGVAALLLVQVLTQSGGIMGLLPLTGVPIPWLSHGLTASLVFTGLAALALATGGGRVGIRQPSEPDSLRYLDAANRATATALAALVILWTVLLPRHERIGPRGRHYRWENVGERARIERWIAEDLFEGVGTGEGVRLAEAAQEHPDRRQLAAVAEGLRYRAPGRIEPLGYLVSNPNRFADRSMARGALTARDGTVLARTGEHGRRLYPRAETFYHPVGYGGPLVRPRGVEAAVRPYLVGRALTGPQRRRAFAADLDHGPDVVLTLDAVLQRTAWEELDGRRGAAVVMDLSDGALLVLASSPAVDPDGAGIEAWRQFALLPDQPLRPRATHATEVYSPPGSVFKIVVAAAALEAGIDPRETTYCPGRDAALRVSCAHGAVHGRVDLRRALVVSCNIYFARTVVRIGADGVRRMAERFGFNDSAPASLLRGVPLADLRPGVSTVDVSAIRSESDLARLGYGQGPVSATPLQIARMGAVVATGGELLHPFLARSLALVRRGAAEDGDAGPQVVWQRHLDAARRERALPRQLAEELQGPLTEVFARGTARRLDKLWWSPRHGWRLAAREPRDEDPGGENPEDEDFGDGNAWRRVGVAGKTGSAWKTRQDRTDDAWMVAWAPAEGPRVVVSVLVEDAGEGGKVAGPITLRLLRDTLETLGHEP